KSALRERRRAQRTTTGTPAGLVKTPADDNGECAEPTIWPAPTPGPRRDESSDPRSWQSLSLGFRTGSVSDEFGRPVASAPSSTVSASPCVTAAAESPPTSGGAQIAYGPRFGDRRTDTRRRSSGGGQGRSTDCRPRCACRNKNNRSNYGPCAAACRG